MNLICPGCQTTNESETHFCKICGAGFDVQPIRQNSISTPLIVIIAVVAVRGFCGLFGLVTGDKTEVAKSTNSLTAVTSPAANSNANSLPLRNLVETSNSTNAAKQKSSKSATVVSENANLRKTADSDGEVIQTVPEDAEIEVIRQKGAWFYVSAGGQTGWLHGNTIRLADGYARKPPAETVEISPLPTPLPKKETPVDSGDSGTVTSSSSLYIRGPRGGCYFKFIKSTGRRVG